MHPNSRTVAYFSMEVGLHNDMPTYSGGLGMLAGDTVRSAADLGVPMVGISLLHRKGYFRQELDDAGGQSEQPAEWSIDRHLTEEEARCDVTIEGRNVQLRCWRFVVKGAAGKSVPVYLLDSDLEENAEQDRRLTDHLYGGDDRYRLCQEVILGMGGIRMLDALGYRGIEHFHLNEGHSALLTFELLSRQAGRHDRSRIESADLERVRSLCVFTTHTPVPAGHDQFSPELAREVLGDHPALALENDLLYEGKLNLTYIALKLSRYVNGVAQRHGEVSRRMFAEYDIDAITNGIHVATWASPSFQDLFDRHLTGWREDNHTLRYSRSISREEIWEAHLQAKRRLFDHVRDTTAREFELDTLTLGFARRATPYKRVKLLFSDLDRLRTIARERGGLQLVFAGKAHPHDEDGKQLIRRVHAAINDIADDISAVYLPEYDMHLGGLLTSGCDVWLNTPLPPMEASGTSGMKAAVNGVPSLSVCDGWWIEGCVPGVTGWHIGRDWTDASLEDEESHRADADSLYEQLASHVMPTYYDRRDEFIDIMRSAIALNGSFFNTHRMVEQYAIRAYALGRCHCEPAGE